MIGWIIAGIILGSFAWAWVEVEHYWKRHHL